LSYRGTEQLAVAGMCLGDLGLGVKRFLMFWGNFLCGEEGRQRGVSWRQRLGALGWAGEGGSALGRACYCREMFSFARQLPARDVLENLPIFRSQTRASFRSRAARAFALPASLSLLCVS